MGPRAQALLAAAVRRPLEAVGKRRPERLAESVGGEPVADLITQRAPTTLKLIAGGFVASLLISIPFALVAATRRDQPADHAIRLGALLSLFLPSFCVAFVLIRFVALPTGWFPVSGLGSSFTD